MSARARDLVILATITILQAGCVGQVAVKDVQSDRPAYLAKTFSLQSVPTSVATAITAKDPGALTFRKMTLRVTPKFVTLVPGSAPPDYRLDWTLVAAGGPFVEYLEDQTSNGIATRQDYGISYRGLQTMRGQTMLLNATESSWVMQVKSVETFTPVVMSGQPAGGVDIRYTWGNPIQIQGMETHTTTCQYGDRYPAAKLNDKFEGEALDLRCEHTNKNGVVSEHSTRTLLTHYGVAIRTRSESASGSVIFQIDDVKIE